jgi:hypothetical protein
LTRLVRQEGAIARRLRSVVGKRLAAGSRRVGHAQRRHPRERTEQAAEPNLAEVRRELLSENATLPPMMTCVTTPSTRRHRFEVVGRTTPLPRVSPIVGDEGALAQPKSHRRQS